MQNWIKAAAIAVSLTLPGVALAQSLESLVNVQGVRENQLVGYSLVVGLDGTGDKNQVKFTNQTITNMLRQFGVQLPNKIDPKVKNVAAVAVSATLPPMYSRDGLISTPQVLTVILPASWRQNVGGGDGLMFVTITVSQCRLCQRLACRWRQNQRLYGITLFLNPVKHAHYLVSPFNDSVHHISPVRNTHFPQRLTTDAPVLADEPEVTRQHLVAGGTVMRVEQNNFRDMFSVYLSSPITAMRRATVHLATLIPSRNN